MERRKTLEERRGRVRMGKSRDLERKWTHEIERDKEASFTCESLERERERERERESHRHSFRVGETKSAATLADMQSHHCRVSFLW